MSTVPSRLDLVAYQGPATTGSDGTIAGHQYHALAVHHEPENCGDTKVLFLQSNGYHENCPALQFLGWLGVSPTDFDGRSLDPAEFGASQVNVTPQGRGVYTLPQELLQVGKERLQAADWFVSDFEDTDGVEVVVGD